MRRLHGPCRIGSVFLLTVLALWLTASALPGQEERGTTDAVRNLPQALQGIEIQDVFLPAESKRVGVIHALEGRVVVVHGKDAGAYFAQAGDRIFEMDTLHTLEDSRCRIRFLGEDVVSMGEQSVFSVESYQDRRAEKAKKSSFHLLKGKVMCYALRLLRYRQVSMDVNTPTTIVGVRGTKFGIHVLWDREEEALEALDHGAYAPWWEDGLVRGDGVETNCFCEDGQVQIKDYVIGPGDMYLGRTSEVIVAPPDYVRDFKRDTTIAPEPPIPAPDSSLPLTKTERVPRKEASRAFKKSSTEDLDPLTLRAAEPQWRKDAMPKPEPRISETIVREEVIKDATLSTTLREDGIQTQVGDTVSRTK